MSTKSLIGRKAAKAVVKHSAHGTVSKARRDPARTSTLLGVGAVAGAAAGFAAGRKTATSPPSHEPVAPPHDAEPAATPVRSTPA